MPTAADEKRGTKLWGPPGGTAGVCLTCGGPARSGRAFYCEEHRPTSKAQTPAPKAEPVEAEPVESVGDMYAERAPSEPKPAKDDQSLLGRFWNGTKKEEKPSAPSTSKPTDERRPVATRRRVSTADFWDGLVTPIAAVSARAGYVPMARAMEWSAPVVGEIVEDATKGTMADRLVQPIVRNGEKWQDLFDLLGFWAAIGVAQRNPMQATTALGFARARLVNLLPRIAKNIKAERKKEKDAVDALVELMPDIRELFPEAGPDDDPVGLLIQSLFSAPEPEPVPV